MNCVRYYLCLCILMNHFNILTGAAIPSLPRIFGGVGSFFAISGFLMFASYEKHRNPSGYFKRRAKRILPPYVFIVLICAIFLSIFSSLPLNEYFSNLSLYKYILYNLCFLNFLEPTLPGVFDTAPNIVDAVNGSLWTMKGEILCYFSVPLLFKLFDRYERRINIILIILALSCFVVYVWMELVLHADQSHLELVSKQFRVFTFFFTGALVNLYLDRILSRKWLILFLILIFMAISQINGILSILIRPFTDSVLVIWCSIIGTWGIWASNHDSLSYNIYLFHFPIIQLLVSTGIIAGTGMQAGLILTIFLSVALAMFSWNTIDKRILKNKIHPDKLIATTR